MIEQAKQTCLKRCSRKSLASATSYLTWVSMGTVLLLMLNLYTHITTNTTNISVCIAHYCELINTFR